MTPGPGIRRGFDETARAQVAALYWQAFGAKLGPVMRPETKALAYVARVMRPDHALSAIGAHGQVLGVVGFKTRDGAFVAGGYRDLAAVYGRFGGLWRLLVLGLLQRDIENSRFLLDGLFVEDAARGTGVGGALIEAICAEAAARGYAEVRLDVVDTNPRARALYERRGFHAVASSRIGPLRHVFGFSQSTVMVRRVAKSSGF